MDLGDEGPRKQSKHFGLQEPRTTITFIFARWETRYSLGFSYVALGIRPLGNDPHLGIFPG